ALIRAALWADQPGNRPALIQLLAQPEYVGASPEVLSLSLAGPRDAIVFHASAANFPWLSHAAWFVAQMRRWGQAGQVDPLEAAAGVYRPDLYRLAAAAVGVSAPMEDSKIELAHTEPWILAGSEGPLQMPADRLLGRRPFDPSAAEAYLQSFPIRRAIAPEV
ncbi:MAG TPA: hypothetical protein VHX64_16840, partial [Caulobacteraceae bacterium]|nr:hypothetical protein [Caulobacteraceae bacterium]